MDLEFPGFIVKLATVRTKTVTHTWTTSMEELVSSLLSFASRTGYHSRQIDLRALGQTTKISRSTVEQVRARIQMLREKTKEASNAKSYDFEQRLAEIKAKEAGLRAEKLKLKRAEKDKARAELAKDLSTPQEEDMMKMMGFSGFGSSKK